MVRIDLFSIQRLQFCLDSLVLFALLGTEVFNGGKHGFRPFLNTVKCFLVVDRFFVKLEPSSVSLEVTWLLY